MSTPRLRLARAGGIDGSESRQELFLAETAAACGHQLLAVTSNARVTECAGGRRLASRVRKHIRGSKYSSVVLRCRQGQRGHRTCTRTGTLCATRSSNASDAEFQLSKKPSSR